jgi:hypothetical protein
MPWQLKTPYSGGDLDKSGVYDQVKIMRFNWRLVPKPSISLTLQYGTTKEGFWCPGVNPVDKPSTVYIKEDEYTEFMAHPTKDSEHTYDAVKRGVYEWLAKKGHVDAGSLT